MFARESVFAMEHAVIDGTAYLSLVLHCASCLATHGCWIRRGLLNQQKSRGKILVLRSPVYPPLAFKDHRHNNQARVDDE